MDTKCALIFGATGGIGSSLCRAFKKRGIKLLLISRNRQKLNGLRDELDIHPSCTFEAETLTSQEELEKASEWLRRSEQKIDFAIHAAGLGIIKNATNISIDEWKNTIDLNVTSSFTFFQLTWPFRCEQSIQYVYFGSASLMQPWPKNCLYGASKAALESFALSLHKDIRPKGGKVWLYKLGSVDTSFFNSISNHLPKAKMMQSSIVADIVVKNLSCPQEVYSPIITLLPDHL